MLWVNGCRRASSQNRRAENAQKDVSSASPHLLDSYTTSETFVCHGEQIQSYLCSAACSPLTVGLWGPGSLRPSPCTGHVCWCRQHLLPGLPTVLRAGAVLSAPSQHSPIWLFQIYINLQREEEGSRLTLCFRRRANSLQGREGLEGEGWRENGGKCLHLPQGGPAFPPRLSKAPGALFSRLVSPIVQPKSWKTGQNPWHPSDRCFHVILNFNTGQKESESGYKTTKSHPFGLSTRAVITTRKALYTTQWQEGFRMWDVFSLEGEMYIPLIAWWTGGWCKAKGENSETAGIYLSYFSDVLGRYGQPQSFSPAHCHTDFGTFFQQKQQTVNQTMNKT